MPDWTDALEAVMDARRTEQLEGTGVANATKPELDIAQYLAVTGAHVLPRDFFQPPNAIIEQFPTIFCKGAFELLRRPCVSVVGTREPSAEGVARAKRVTSVLVDLGIVVVSGLAKGIDTVAHKTAIERNGLTVAVLGTPIHKIYPAENKTLAAEIASKGVLLSPALPHEERGQWRAQ